MAQRFGGRFSPDGPPPGVPRQTRPPKDRWRDARVDPAGARSNVLFVPPMILGFSSLGQGAADLAIAVAAAGALLGGAWLLREGLKAEAAFHARKLARRPAVPRKILAALACGTGTAMAAYLNEPGLLAPLLYGAVASVLHLGAFGLDPLHDKLGETSDNFQHDRVARVVDEAESHLTAMRDALRDLRDRGLEARVEGFQAHVRSMIRAVEDDPRDLTAARKYLGVYLIGARDAAQKYAALASRQDSPTAKADFLALLGDLEEGFDRKTQKLLADNGAELTVEIDVLRDRLRRDGLHLDR